MNKVTVTKKEMEAIEIQRDKWNHYLKVVLEFKQNGNFRNGINRSLNEMSIEQIVLAWHGYVEVEPDYISFYEAFKVRKGGKKVLFHINGLTYELYPNSIIEKTWANKYSLTDLTDGKWSIEGANNA